MRSHPARHRGARQQPAQRGVATLVVVLILFFMVSMVAAYTNRNLIFEQRTSSNQYRSSQALDAAEAGLEWAISMLNLGRIDASCTASDVASDTPFRKRYLTTDGTGRITPVTGSGGEISAACVFNGTGWTCSCPVGGVGTVTSPSSAGLYPAFRVRFQKVVGVSSSDPVPRQPGVVKVQVVGCTRPDSLAGEQCLTFTGLGAASEGRAIVTALLALTGGPSSLPQAALTARDRVQVSGVGFSAYNSVAGGSGVTVHSGASITGYDKLVSQTGSPGGGQSIIAGDSTLQLSGISGANAITDVDRMFAAVFNMRPDTFRDQQAAVALACGSGGCSAAEVRTAASRNPWRPIWIGGDLVVDSAGDIGSAAEPVLLVVNGDLQFAVSGVNIYGMVYVRKGPGSTVWATSGGGQVNGAAVCDGRVEGNGTTTYVYDPAINGLLRWNTGSYVRVPGSWRDFQ